MAGYAPIVPVMLHGRDVALLSEAYVDSGAMVSIFVDSVRELLKLPLSLGKRSRFVVGDGKMIYGYTYRLRIKIGEGALLAPICFSSDLKVGFNLLGRAGIFSHFSEVIFQEERKKVIFRA